MFIKLTIAKPSLGETKPEFTESEERFVNINGIVSFTEALHPMFDKTNNKDIYGCWVKIAEEAYVYSKGTNSPGNVIITYFCLQTIDELKQLIADEESKIYKMVAKELKNEIDINIDEE